MNLGRFIVSKARKSKQKANKNETAHKGKEKVKQDLNKLFNSVEHLFEPFKKAILSMFPKAKPVVTLLNKIAVLLSKVVTLIVYLVFFVLGFIKSKLFKLLVIVFIFLFLFSIVLSRVINTSNYKSYFQSALTEITGYQANVNGSVKIGIVPKPSIFINNVSFSNPQGSYLNSNSNLKVSKFETNKIKLNFKITQLFLGKLVVDSIQLEGANVVLKTLFIAHDFNSQEINEQIKHIFQEAAKQNSLKHFNTNQEGDVSGNKELTLEQEEGDYNSYSLDLNDLKAQDSLQEPQSQSEVDENNSFFKSLNKFILSKIIINPKQIGSLSHSKVNLVLLNKRNNTLVQVHNSSGSLKRSITGKVTSSGYFFTGKEKHSYSFDLTTTEEGNKNLEISLNLGNKAENILKVQGVVNSFTSDLKLSANKGALTYLFSFSETNNKLFNIDSLSKAELNANITFNNKGSLITTVNSLQELSVDNASNTKGVIFKDINFKLNNGNRITGSIFLLPGNYENITKLDLTLNTQNIESIYAGYKEKVARNRSIGQSNTSYLFVYFNTFYNSFFKMFDSTYSFTNINVVSQNPSNPLNITASISKDSKGQYYLNNLSAGYSGTEFSISGLLYPELAQAKLISFAKGNIEDVFNFFSLNDYSINALNAVFKNSNGFSTVFDVSIQNSKIYFSNVMLKLDNIAFNNIQVNIEERVAIIDIAIDIKQDSFDFNYFLDVINPSANMSSSNLLAIEKDSFLGIGDKINIDLKIESSDFIFKDIKLRDLKANVALSSSGIVAQRFEVSSTTQGKALLFFSYNKNVNPALAGNITFSNFALNIEDINNYFFSNYRTKGKVVLNGRLKSSSMVAKDFLDMTQGDFRFVKLERFKSNKANSNKGFFATLSKSSKKINGKTEVYVNDLYGSLQVFSGKVDFFPVVIDYLHGKKKHRGSFEGSLNLATGMLDIRGNISGTAKSSKPMSYYFKGDIKNPEYKFSKSDGSLIIKQPVLAEEKKEEKKERTKEAKEIEQQALKTVKESIKDKGRNTNIDSIGIGKNTDVIKPSQQLRGTNFNNTGKISNPGSSKVNSKSLVPDELGRKEVAPEKTQSQKEIQELEKQQGVENKTQVKIVTPKSEFEKIYPSNRSVLDSSKQVEDTPSAINTNPSTTSEKSTTKDSKEEDSTKKDIPKGVDIELWE